MTRAAASEPKRRRTPEHTFQSWADRLIDRIVLPPMFVTGIDHASQTTDNARARMAGRGIKFGLPDMFVAQRDGHLLHSVWLELKRGTSLSAAQVGVHVAMRAAGLHVWTCRTMADVVASLRDAGVALHPNADNLAVEYEERAKAREAAPRTPRAYKPRPVRPTAAQVQRARAAGVLV